jgi:hypothetical protein
MLPASNTINPTRVICIGSTLLVSEVTGIFSAKNLESTEAVSELQILPSRYLIVYFVSPHRTHGL